jgi:transcriptional regulator with XRE-family HTH domain
LSIAVERFNKVFLYFLFAPYLQVIKICYNANKKKDVFKMGEIRDTLISNLNYYIKRSGIEQKEIAAGIGVSSGAVTNWMRGQNTPDIETLNNLCKFLGVSLSDMLESKKPEAIKSVGPWDARLNSMIPMLSEEQKQSLCAVMESFLPKDTERKG